MRFPTPLLLLLLAACGGGRSDVVASPWLEASPVLKQQIEDEAQRLPWTTGFERLEQIRWFASVGEPAYDKLIQLARDSRPDVAAAALAAMGATMDERLVPYIQDLPWAEAKRFDDLGLERARTLLRLGDWSEIPLLIHGLKDERLYTRSLCFEALRNATHETHDFDPRAEPRERELAVERWEDWWRRRGGEGLIES